MGNFEVMEIATRKFQREGIKVAELIEELRKCDPDAEVWLPNVNELDIPGYCMLDHIMVMPFDTVESDVMDNPGRIDYRLLKNKTENTQIVYLGSLADHLKKGVANPTENR